MCVIYCKRYKKAYEPQNGVCPACGERIVNPGVWKITMGHSEYRDVIDVLRKNREYIPEHYAFYFDTKI